MIVGMDFGTTNSGMAVYDGRSATILPLDPSSPNPRVARTAIYITNEQNVHIGRDAIDHYYQQNIGRPVKIRKVWVGEIDVYAEDMHYVTDAYVYVDVLSPGRLFLSVKSSLRESSYPGTVVGQYFYSLENLISLYLNITKTRAEQLLDQPVDHVVLGRPVRFANDPEMDRLAQARLLQAAFRAGYKTAYLQYEPIAAAYSYETTLSEPQNVLVFDFGGGTLDLTVMRLGERPRQVLATGGIPVAGDVFDQKLVRAKLPRHFGEGSLYGARHKAQPIPKWIFDSFSDWQKLLELQSRENRPILDDIARTAQRKWQLEALQALIASNYGLKMYDIVEQSKRRLSEKRGAEILLEGEGFSIREFVTRTEFEGLIRAEINAIDAHIDETVLASGLRPDQIDAVIRTGGSSQIPAFVEMLGHKFGAEKVLSLDTFSSVTAGLGVIGHGIEAGEIDLRAYTPDDAKVPPAEHQPKVPPVNLDVMQRRIAVAEGVVETDAIVAERALVALGADGTVTAVAHPAKLSRYNPTSLADLGVDGPLRQLLAADWDETLLLITNKYRFLLFTPRQLQELQETGLAITDQHQFDRLEVVTTMASWRAIKQRDKLLLATSLGVARPYPLNVMIDNIEVPVPLRFDHPLLGEPIAAFGVDGDEQILLATAGGRAVRWPIGTIRTSGVQAINCGTDDRVAAALVVADPLAEVALLTVDGYGRLFPAVWVEVPPKPNRKGKSQVARRSDLLALLSAAEPAHLLTAQRIIPIDFINTLREDSTKTDPVVDLEKGEVGTAVFVADG